MSFDSACNALIVSKDGRLSGELRECLEEHDYQVRVAHGTSTGATKLPRAGRPLVFLDLRGDELWGELPSLRRNLGCSPSQPLQLIGMVEHGYAPERVPLVNSWLHSTLELPLDRERLSRMLFLIGQQDGNGPDPYAAPRVLEGASRRFLTYMPSMFAMLDDLEVVARHDFTILLVGETGTGKTYLARLIHELSPRCENRFLTVACGALPNELLGSELFGHVKGSFTGADRPKQGKFDVAAGGTILLDEIDVLGLDQQAKLLRVLETGEYEPVGSNETRITNTRAIVASNLDLTGLIEQDKFRADLYFRLKQVMFEVPPLRKRRLDIVPLAMTMIEECCRQHSLSVRHIHPDLLDILKHYHWPGNVRELRNELRRAVLFCRGGALTPELLSPSLVFEARRRQEEGELCTAQVGLAGHVAHTEQETIEQMLRTHNFNRAATARALGISRVTLYNKIRKYRIRIDD